MALLECIHLYKDFGEQQILTDVNLTIPEGKIMPLCGVYCAKVTVDGKEYMGIANVGSKPTVQELPVYGLETHLFDCNEDLYGKQVTTELLHFVRPEQKFSSVEELREQLEKDKQYGRTYFDK